MDPSQAGEQTRQLNDFIEACRSARRREADARHRQSEEEQQHARAVAEKKALEQLHRFRATLHTLDQLGDVLTLVPGVATTWPEDEPRRQ
jgi:hypothetical protein